MFFRLFLKNIRAIVGAEENTSIFLQYVVE